MKINLKELSLFSMLSAIMVVSKLLLEAIPNFHLLAVFTIATTVVYRGKALYVIYGYVFLQGIIAGFNPWWVIHLYVWTILWGITMLLPRGLNRGKATVMYMTVSALHGLLYGTLCAPVQMLFFGLKLSAVPVWILSGLPFDLVHAAHNLLLGLLIMPIIMVLIYAKKHTDS